MRSHEEDAQMFRNTNEDNLPKVEAEPYKKNAIDTWEWYACFYFLFVNLKGRSVYLNLWGDNLS